MPLCISHNIPLGQCLAVTHWQHMQQRQCVQHSHALPLRQCLTVTHWQHMQQRQCIQLTHALYLLLHLQLPQRLWLHQWEPISNSQRHPHTHRLPIRLHNTQPFSVNHHKRVKEPVPLKHQHCCAIGGVNALFTHSHLHLCPYWCVCLQHALQHALKYAFALTHQQSLTWCCLLFQHVLRQWQLPRRELLLCHFDSRRV